MFNMVISIAHTNNVNFVELSHLINAIKLNLKKSHHIKEGSISMRLW